MSKFIAEKTFRMTNENNDLVISYVVHGLEKDAALLAYEETRNSEKKLEVEVKPYRSKRSLEQNKLLWVLLGKLAMAMSGKKNKVSSEEAYAIKKRWNRRECGEWHRANASVRGGYDSNGRSRCASRRFSNGKSRNLGRKRRR